MFASSVVAVDGGDGAMDTSTADAPVDATGPDAGLPDATTDGGTPDSGAPTSAAFVDVSIIGGSGAERCFSLGMNAAGAHAITGKFRGDVDLGEGLVSPVGSDDTFVVVYESDGSVRWARAYGTSSSDGGNDIDVDDSGRVFVAGEFRGNLDFGGGGLPNAGDIDLFLTRLSATGTHDWSAAGGSAVGELGHAGAFDDDGGGALTGYLRGSGSFGVETTGYGAGREAVLARYDASGVVRWVRTLSGTGNAESRGVAITSSGLVVVAGFFDGAVDLGMGAVTAAGNDAFVVAYDDGGRVSWVRTMVGPGGETATGIAVDEADRIYIVGDYEDGAMVEGAPLPAGAGQNGYVFSLDPSGALRWARGFGAAGNQTAHGVATRNGRVYATGYFDGALALGPLTFVATAGRDGFWAALSAVDGAPLYGGHLEGATALGIGASRAGLVAVSGYFSGSANFGAGPRMEAGGGDVFVARFRER